MRMLGMKVRDRVTGFQGVAVSYVQYLTGCNQYGVTPPVGADGKYPACEYFDEQRLETTSDEVLVLDNSQAPGFGAPPTRRY